jgi:hypothetical protein
MPEFLTYQVKWVNDLVLRRKKDKVNNASFIVDEDFKVGVFGIFLTVPAGFESDLASVPRCFRWLVSVTDAIEGSIIHDFLYRVPGIHGRQFADQVLIAMAEVQGTSWLRRKAMYFGVRVGGYFTWRQARGK